MAFLILGCAGPRSEPSETKRLVSLAPNLTEIIYALGQGRWLVGVTAQCDYPPEVQSIDKVGDYYRPSLERIVKLKPSLVLAALPEQRLIVDELTSLGFKVRAFPAETVDEIFRNIEVIAQELGAVREGDSLIRALKEGFERIPSPPDTPRVYLEISANPLISVGGGSFLNDLLPRAGGENIFTGVAQDYPIVNSEAVIAKDPEVILLLHSQTAPDEIAKRLGWERISAVRSGRVYSGLNLDLLLRPGPRVVLGCKELFRLLH